MFHGIAIHLDGLNLRNMADPLDRHSFGWSVNVYVDRPNGPDQMDQMDQAIHLDGQLMYI